MSMLKGLYPAKGNTVSHSNLTFAIFSKKMDQKPIKRGVYSVRAVKKIQNFTKYIHTSNIDWGLQYRPMQWNTPGQSQGAL